MAVACLRCGSEDVTALRRGFVSFLAGPKPMKDIIITCLQCGFEWKAGEAANARTKLANQANLANRAVPTRQATRLAKFLRNTAIFVICGCGLILLIAQLSPSSQDSAPDLKTAVTAQKQEETLDQCIDGQVLTGAYSSFDGGLSVLRIMAACEGQLKAEQPDCFKEDPHDNNQDNAQNVSPGAKCRLAMVGAIQLVLKGHEAGLPMSTESHSTGKDTQPSQDSSPQPDSAGEGETSAPSQTPGKERPESARGTPGSVARPMRGTDADAQPAEDAGVQELFNIPESRKFSAEFRKCLDVPGAANNARAITACSDDEVKVQQKQLGEIYSRVAAKMNAEDLAAFEQQDRDWIQGRDLKCSQFVVGKPNASVFEKLCELRATVQHEVDLEPK